MEDLSERYYEQFTAMEQAISAYTTQATWLSQQIAQMTGSSE
jgi:flagellar capping protein FliD